MNYTQLVESKRTKRNKAQPPCVKSAYFSSEDQDLYNALAKLAPSRNGGGPNLTAYLKSHREAIIEESRQQKGQ